MPLNLLADTERQAELDNYISIKIKTGKEEKKYLERWLLAEALGWDSAAGFISDSSPHQIPSPKSENNDGSSLFSKTGLFRGFY